MRRRSTFKQKRKATRSAKALFSLAQKKVKKTLSMNLLQLPSIAKFRPKSRSRHAKSYLRRDVHQKSFQNPYQKKASTKKVLFRLLSTKRYLLAQLGLVTALGIWFIVLFVQPTFYLDRIAIAGTEEIQQDDLRAMIAEYMNKRSFMIIKRSHLFFFDEAQLESLIRERYGLESISFTSHWPSRSVNIDLKEKSSILIYSVDDNYYTIDKKGTIIRQAEHEQLLDKIDTPTIYEFDRALPEIGQQVLTETNIQTLLTLYTELQKYPFLAIHSFRLKPANKQTVVIPEKLPEARQQNQEESDAALNQNLDTLAESIAQANTVEEKIEEIKSALGDIDIEKLEEGEIERYLEQEKVFEPNDSITFNEIEVFTTGGWSLLLGTELLRNPDSLENYLNIFATLNKELAIEGEVKEYIDLRFPNRVYYR